MTMTAMFAMVVLRRLLLVYLFQSLQHLIVRLLVLGFAATRSSKVTARASPSGASGMTSSARSRAITDSSLKPVHETACRQNPILVSVEGLGGQRALLGTASTEVSLL